MLGLFTPYILGAGWLNLFYLLQMGQWVLVALSDTTKLNLSLSQPIAVIFCYFWWIYINTKRGLETSRIKKIVALIGGVLIIFFQIGLALLELEANTFPKLALSFVVFDWTFIRFVKLLRSK